jgi:hypothetical protein
MGDGRFANEKSFADLFVLQSITNQGDYLALADGE